MGNPTVNVREILQQAKSTVKKILYPLGIAVLPWPADEGTYYDIISLALKLDPDALKRTTTHIAVDITRFALNKVDKDAISWKVAFAEIRKIYEIDSFMRTRILGFWKKQDSAKRKMPFHHLEALSLGVIVQLGGTK